MRCLLSIDWDYFIKAPKSYRNSFFENQRTIQDLWYKRYIQLKDKGINIKNLFKLDNYRKFWGGIIGKFNIGKDTRVFVSDSHKLSYDIACRAMCNTVFLFDSHSDLGYGGLMSLKFDVNCANWLGKLLKDKKINKAHIIYSPNTFEDKDYFKDQNSMFDIEYNKLEELPDNINVTAVHICRSGAWAPPWYDSDFKSFLNYTKLKYNLINYKERSFDVSNLTLADRINYLLA